MKTFVVLAVLASAFTGFVPADAVPVNLNYDITATNFISYGGTLPIPVDPVHLNFSLAFDNRADVSNSTSGLTVNSFNAPYQLRYTYFASGDYLAIGTDTSVDLQGCLTFSIARGTFCAFINDVSTLSADSDFVSQSTPEDEWDAQTITTMVTAPAVPEPASWAMLISGIGLVGGMMRRQNRSRSGTATT